MVGDKKGKEAADIWKEQKKWLHEHIESHLYKADNEFKIHRETNNTTDLWKVWSKAVEKGWLTYLGEGQMSDKKAKGRGEMTLIKVDPTKAKQPPKASKGERGGQHDAAYNALQQARRCEQLACRLEMLNDETKEEAKRQHITS